MTLNDIWWSFQPKLSFPRIISRKLYTDKWDNRSVRIPSMLNTGSCICSYCSSLVCRFHSHIFHRAQHTANQRRRLWNIRSSVRHGVGLRRRWCLGGVPGVLAPFDTARPRDLPGALPGVLTPFPRTSACATHAATSQSHQRCHRRASMNAQLTWYTEEWYNKSYSTSNLSWCWVVIFFIIRPMYAFNVTVIVEMVHRSLKSDCTIVYFVNLYWY